MEKRIFHRVEKALLRRKSGFITEPKKTLTRRKSGFATELKGADPEKKRIFCEVEKRWRMAAVTIIIS